MILDGQPKIRFAKALEKAILSKGGVIALAESLNVSRATIYSWRNKPCIPEKKEHLEALGLDLKLLKLKPRSNCPATTS